MIPLLQKQFFVELANAAKQQPSEELTFVDESAEELKQQLQTNLSERNASRILAYRKRKEGQGLAKKLRSELSEFEQVKAALTNRIELLEAELRYYKKLHDEQHLNESLGKKTELEELLELEEQLYQKAKDAEKLHHQGKLSHEEVEKIEEKLNDMLQGILKRKEELEN